MEVILNNVAIKNKIKNLNLTFENNKITGFCGDNKDIIGKSILGLETLESGTIKIGNYLIEAKRNKNLKDIHFNVGYLFSNPQDFLFNRTVEEEIKMGMKHFKYRLEMIDKRILESISILGLKPDILKKDSLALSYSEQKKVMLAAVLAYNPKILILDEFEKGLCKRDKINVKRLLKTIRRKYKKTIIVITDDIEFMFDFCDKIKYMEDSKLIVDGTNEEFFNNRLYRYIDKPKIIDFINYFNKNNHNCANYTDLNELIKAVYRGC